MYPISLNTGGLIYTMGGCIINLLSGISCLVIILTVSMSPLMWLYLWCFSVFGIGLNLMNGISSTERVCNDKACYNLLKEDERTRLCHNGQLICLCQDTAKNDIQAYQAILEYYYYLDKNDYTKVGNAINKVSRKENLSKDTLGIVEMELNYVLLLSEIKLLLNFHLNNKSYNKVYDKSKVSHGNITNDKFSHECKSESHLNLEDIKQSITEHKKGGDVHTLRVITIYETYSCFVAGDMDRAGKILNDGINLIEKTNTVYLGEKKFCINELKKVKRMIDSIMRTNITNKLCAI